MDKRFIQVKYQALLAQMLWRHRIQQSSRFHFLHLLFLKHQSKPSRSARVSQGSFDLGPNKKKREGVVWWWCTGVSPGQCLDRLRPVLQTDLQAECSLFHPLLPTNFHFPSAGRYWPWSLHAQCLSRYPEASKTTVGVQ